MTGFNNALSFTTIDDNDISQVEVFIRDELLNILIEMERLEYVSKNEYIHFFGHLYKFQTSKFKFQCGEIKLIKQLVKYAREKTDVEGLHYFQKKNGTDSSVSFFFGDIKTNQIGEKAVVHKNETPKPNLPSQSHVVLNKLKLVADQNAKRQKAGYRFPEEIKLFSSYFRMLAGKRAYEFIQRNLPESIPSLSSVNKNIRKRDSPIIEGVLRCDELLLYLQERQLPLSVSLSEDATRIIGRVQYDARSNQIVGFVLPSNENNGMPIPYSFNARNAKEIATHFFSGNNISSFVNVIMAQPLADVPPFCLLLFGSNSRYTTADVANRWEFLIQKLSDLNIRVLTISSDSDPKYNSAMRKLSHLGCQSNLFLNYNWFSCGDTKTTFYVQDTIHIGTKMRNFLLKTISNSMKLPFGKKFYIQFSHLNYLLQNFPKDQHLLTASVLNPIDRQNFQSVMRICDNRVIELLKKNVPQSEGTVKFLEILQNIIHSYMDRSLTPLERIHKMWYSVFMLRIWREYILSSKKFKLKENFLTANCYTCIELNAHSLVHCLLFLKRSELPHYFLPHLFSSQPCEGQFRKIRSFTSTYSTVANCTVKEIMGRVTKIQLQYDISNDSNSDFLFSNKKVTPNQETGNNNGEISLPTEDEIVEEINKCKARAIKDAVNIGLLNPKSNKQIPCKIKAYDSYKYAEKVTQTESHLITSIVPKIKSVLLKDYTDQINGKIINEASPFVEIIYGKNNKRKVVKKTSLCWLWRKDCYRVSSDRLERVKTAFYKKRAVNKKQILMTKLRPHINKRFQ